MINLARKYHKWLMAFIGIQFLFWAITGVYMVSMDIHYIHGETLAKNDSSKLQLANISYPIKKLLNDYPKASNINLIKAMDDPVYLFTDGEKGKLVVNANTGMRQGLIDKQKALTIAQYYYAQGDNVKTIRLISEIADMPMELSPRHLPVWRITFDDVATPTFYINQQTGALVAKRHDFWRLFDWMWRFHIMDYDDGENVSNWLLSLVSILGLLAVISGAILTYFRVVTPNKQETI